MTRKAMAVSGAEIARKLSHGEGGAPDSKFASCLALWRLLWQIGSFYELTIMT